MKLLSRSLLAAAVIVAALSFCATAGAAVVSVGPSLGGSWTSYYCGEPECTFVNDELGGTGANVKSPVTGAVVGFNVVGGVTVGTYRLRTMEQQAGSDVAYVFQKMTAPIAAVRNAGVQHYSTSLPVSAGQTVGLSLSSTASAGFLENVGRLSFWGEIEPETGLLNAEFTGVELVGFNAEVQPSPTIASLGTTSGLTTGGTSVTITGTDFEGASGVSFGTTPAVVTADSETSITATAPASAAAVAVPVTVTTVAGTATAAQTFTYEKPVYCVVPNLAGRKLAAAKKALGKAKCKVGTIKKLAGASAKTGKVSKQSPKAGSKLAVGSKVAVTLKPAKTAGKKHKK